MAKTFEIDDAFIAEQNEKARQWVEEDYDALAKKLLRHKVDIEDLTLRAAGFRVAVPSWGVGTGGTRFARFPGVGEPRSIFEKLEDCGTIFKLVRSTPGVSLHIPWDKPENVSELREFARARGLNFDAMNSNTFQDQPGQKLSYKYGSMQHVDPAVRKQAVDHNIEVIKYGIELGSESLTVWLSDGSCFPGQLNFRKAFQNTLESLQQVYAALPEPWKMFVEYK